MKKVLLVIVALMGIAGANAQFKDSGLKIIGEVGTGVSVARASILGFSETSFGMLTPGLEISLGANVAPQFFIGGGVGYDAQVGVSDFSGTSHEAKAFAHGRYYFSSEGNGVIADLKVGYKRNFSEEMNAADIFVGPGFMFGDKFTLSVGYAGTFYSTGIDGLSLNTHGGAIKFGIEF